MTRDSSWFVGRAAVAISAAGLFLAAPPSGLAADEELSPAAKKRREMRLEEIEKKAAVEAKAKRPRTPLTKERIRKLADEAGACRVFHPERCEALEEITAHGDAAGPLAADLLADAEPVRRAAGALVVGQVGYAAGGGKLLALLDDADSRVRVAALSSIGRLQPKGGVEALAARLGTESLNEKLTAVVALGQTRAPGAVSPLLTVLSHPHAKLRATAARALGALGDKRATRPIAVLLADPKGTAPEREAACDALGRLADPDGVPMLLLATGDAGDEVRRAAVTALGLVADARATAALSLLVRDPKLTALAAEALGRIGDAGALPALVRVLKERRGDEKALESAFAALGKIKSASAVSALLPYLADEDPRVATWAADALGRIGDRRAADPLVVALRREDRDLKDMAVWALQEITGKSLGDDPERWDAWLHPAEE